MTTTALERIRANLAGLIDAAAAEIEAERKANQPADDAAIAAAYERGKQDERTRALGLIAELRQALLSRAADPVHLVAVTAMLVEGQS